MSTFIWCEIVCDECSQSGPGEFTLASRLPRKELKAAAKAQGWTFVGNGAYCNEHRCKENRAAASQAPGAGGEA